LIPWFVLSRSLRMASKEKSTEKTKKGSAPKELISAKVRKDLQEDVLALYRSLVSALPATPEAQLKLLQEKALSTQKALLQELKQILDHGATELHCAAASAAIEHWRKTGKCIGNSNIFLLPKLSADQKKAVAGLLSLTQFHSFGADETRYNGNAGKWETR